MEFLKGFHGYLHADGYSGYNKLENITRCGCWAHLRRKFVEAVAGKKASGAPPTAAETGRDYCDQFFRMEKQLKESSIEKRYKKRLGLEKPVLEAFWCWLDSVQFLKGSALGKGGYLCQESKTIYGKLSKANGLNVYTYLEYLLLYMPDTDWQNHPENLDELMPWSETVQAEYKTQLLMVNILPLMKLLFQAPCCKSLTKKVYSAGGQTTFLLKKNKDLYWTGTDECIPCFDWISKKLSSK